ncbi:MAG TPA: hypothetical protein VEG25_09665 [Burkholderiales bacterium]|nr:hypothetical protein [Burkholderiales bacterium]
MAIHPDTVSMLQESLREYLCVAEWCVHYQKDASWGSKQIGGRLGYPAAVMMFCIADTIGSFHRGNTSFSAPVDGKAVMIRQQGFHHFYVLNSDYYRQSLSEAAIKRLYANFRDLLVHNAALAPEHILISLPTVPEAFPIIEGRQLVNINGFLRVSDNAVKLFLERLAAVVPGSSQEVNIQKKR